MPEDISQPAARLLLVDDNADNLQLMAAQLKRLGAEVRTAENGVQAVDRVRSERFDVVLMDLQMPDMDGLTATRILRERGHGVPILILSGRGLAADRAACIAAGCTDYLLKPIDQATLISAVQRHLPDTAGPDSCPAEPSVNRITHLKSLYADDDDMREIIGEFVRGLPGHVDRMRRLLAGGPMEDLRRQLHQLKGAGGGYGFARITELAAQAEQNIKEQASHNTIAAGVESLIALLRTVEGYDASREQARADSARH